jgi:endo-1,4-beta-mannosidase
MSGPNWMPAWSMSDAGNNRPRVYVVDGGESPHKPRDIFGADGMVFEAERLLIRTVVRRLHAHRALWGWDLCNEIDIVQLPETGAGERWLQTLVADVHAVDADHPVTAGFLIWPDESPRGFHRASHRLVDVASVHAYPLYDSRAAGPGDTTYVARMIEETRSAAGVPALLTEFGMSTNPAPGTRHVAMTWAGYEQTVSLVNEDEAASFVRDVLPVARDAGATGALIWCFSDYDPLLYRETPFHTLIHERYFGIFDAQGRLKPTGEALRSFASTIR